MRGRYTKVVAVVFAALGVLAMAAAPLFADSECYDLTVAKHLMSLVKDPGAVSAYLQHSTTSADSHQIKLDAYSSSTYKVAKYVDNIGKLNNKVRNTEKFWQMVWNGGSCVTVSFELAKVYVYYPGLVPGLCGPSTSISGGLTVGGSWESDGNDHWRLMPIIRDYVKGEVSLKCGYTCFDVWGGINVRGEVGFEPDSAYPYYAIEAYAKLTLGPDAGAHFACARVWGWSENLYTHKKVFAVEWL